LAIRRSHDESKVQSRGNVHKKMTNEEIARFFNTTRPFIQGNPDLRDPQVEGWFLIGERSYEGF